MKKREISKLFLYRYRFHIGYILLSLAFIFLVLVIPEISIKGLSDIEMRSTSDSYNLHFSSITSTNLVDLPYHILQKLSILIFGFNTFAIKLPSTLVATALGFLLILLLNRWFKSNVALLSSVLAILSIPFLFLASSGSPAIMVVFWPCLLLWLGSKIQGEKKPRASFCFIFAFALLFSIFTPHMIYLAIFIVAYVLLNPHLRFTVRTLPKLPFFSFCAIIALGLIILIMNFISNPTVAANLFAAENLSFEQYLINIKDSLTPFFNWSTNSEGIYLTPLISLPLLFLAFTGLFSTVKGFFASRNSIATCLIIFTLFISGFSPDASLLYILPLSILVAHGLKYILKKWYGLFPENPYARVFGILPISTFIIIMIISSLSHFIFGYRYTPSVANCFRDDLKLVSELPENTTLLLNQNTTEYTFYKAYEDRTHNITIKTIGEKDLTYPIATLGKIEDLKELKKAKIEKIITSPKSLNSDIIYIYTDNSNN